MNDEKRGDSLPQQVSRRLEGLEAARYLLFSSRWRCLRNAHPAFGYEYQARGRFFLRASANHRETATSYRWRMEAKFPPTFSFLPILNMKVMFILWAD